MDPVNVRDSRSLSEAPDEFSFFCYADCNLEPMQRGASSGTRRSPPTATTATDHLRTLLLGTMQIDLASRRAAEAAVENLKATPGFASRSAGFASTPRSHSSCGNYQHSS